MDARLEEDWDNNRMAPTSHILLIEDDTLSGELVQFILENAGFTVIWVPDGRAAATRIDSVEPPPNLVITELVMPYLDGWSVMPFTRLCVDRCAVPGWYH